MVGSTGDNSSETELWRPRCDRHDIWWQHLGHLFSGNKRWKI